MTPLRDSPIMSTTTTLRTPFVIRVHRRGRYRCSVACGVPSLTRCDAERRDVEDGEEDVNRTDASKMMTSTSCAPPCRHRGVVTATLATVASVSLALSTSELAWAGGNDAVLAALAKRQTAETMTTGGVENRLQKDIDEAVRARTLALAGNYDGARRILREGSLSKLRLDLQTTVKFIRDNANEPVLSTRDVTLALDAFDDALRAESIEVDTASIEDVRRTADALIEALKGVVDRIERASAPSTGGY